MGQSVVKQFAFLPPTASYGDTFPNVWITRGEERIPAVFVEGARDRRRPVTILYTHGNAEDIGQMGEWMQHLSQRLRVNILFYDYSGYGLNRGQLSESACYRDAESCFAYLTKVRSIDPRNVILMGRSLGSGPTVFLANLLCKKPNPELGCPQKGGIGGLVLQSALSSCCRTVSKALAFVPFTDMFANIDRISAVTCPTFVIHGRADEVVPFSHGEALWSKLRQSARWRMLPLDEAGHNDIEQRYYDELTTSLLDFVDHVEANAIAGP